MKAIQMHAYGGPEVLAYEEVPRPEPQRGQILVKIDAAAVNPIDAKIRSGAMKDMRPIPFPFIPGNDFAGTVEEVGPGVTQFQVGQAVYGDSQAGAYAEHVAVATDAVAGKPQRLDMVQAASVPVGAMTAWQGIFEHGGLQPGQTLLVQGGAGGVGMFAVQLAKWKGATVIATASGDDVAFVKSLGADQVIDYKTTPFETVVKDVDVVLSLIGGETQQKSFGVLKPGGKLVATAQPPDEALAKQHNVQGIIMGLKPSADLLRQISELFDAGKLVTDVGTVLPLSQAGEAQGGKHSRGKVVLVTEP